MFDIVEDPVLCVFKNATFNEGPAEQSGNVNVCCGSGAASAGGAACWGGTPLTAA